MQGGLSAEAGTLGVSERSRLLLRVAWLCRWSRGQHSLASEPRTGAESRHVCAVRAGVPADAGRSSARSTLRLQTVQRRS